MRYGSCDWNEFKVKDEPQYNGMGEEYPSGSSELPLWFLVVYFVFILWWYFYFLVFVVDMDPKSLTTMNTTHIPHMDPIDIGLGSMEKGNTSLSTKSRKKTMTSVYLRYFETALDGKSRRCKFCGQNYSIATATGYFLNWLPSPIFPFSSIISRCMWSISLQDRCRWQMIDHL